ncbi:MAG: DNA recombination protein RmuC [Ruminiclostridium sp.]|nr:DNA recombination protein RmuC [Ruminiclostridium sp.]
MILLIILIAVVIALGVLIFIRTGKKDDNNDKLTEEIKVLALNQAELKERTAVLMSAVGGITAGEEQRQSQLRLEISESINKLGIALSNTQKQSADGTANQLSQLEKRLQGLEQGNNNAISELAKTLSAMQKQSAEGVANQLSQFEKRLQGFEQGNNNALSEIRATVSRQLLEIKDDNGKRLEQIRKTVDEQLQTTLEEKMNRSFKTVSEQLEKVYKGLGEMQSLASGVGDLKKVLSNVKTRGILGEMQLGAIISEILNGDQYDTEVATIPDSRDRVEFAIKLPGNDNGTVYLPIDSKFPGDTYAALQDAYSMGDKAQVEIAFRNLEARIKQCAKDIRDKYIKPPYTTNFAIMFLPFEGLYAEVVNHGLVEILQREYNVNIAGPSTMAALLNSLQMGFRTLAIEKRSNEVWQVLGAVKSEFETFEKVLTATQKHMKQAEEDLEKLVGTRTRAITKKLRSVEALPTDSSTANLIDMS